MIENDQSKPLTYLMYAILGLLVLWGLAEHFYGLRELGISGSDEYFYWQSYKDWSEGNVTLTNHYRPVAYFIFSKIYSIFPNAHYHKVTNAFFDVVTLFICIQIAKKHLSTWYVGACAGIVVFCSPIPTLFSRDGILHASSATMLLAALYFYLENKNFYHSFLCGIFLSAAANIHPDLGVTFPLFAIGFIAQALLSKDKRELKNNIINFLVFCLSFSIIFLLTFYYFGFIETIESILGNRKSQSTGTQRTFWENLFRISYHYLRFATSKVNVAIFLSAIVYVAIKLAKKKFWVKNHFIFIVLTVSYLFLCNIFFGRTLIPRLFIPFLPIMYLCWMDLINRTLIPKMKFFILGLITIVMIYFARTERPTAWFMPSSETPSYAKVLDDEASRKLDPSKNFLIAPFLVYHIHAFLEKDVYMNGKGVYLALSNEASIAELIKNRDIHYVVWSRLWLDDRIFGTNIKANVVQRLENFYQIKPSQYTVETEYELLLQKLAPYKPEKIHDTANFTIFRLNTKQEQL